MLKLSPGSPARRRCIHCREFFNSTHAAHRVCPQCRRGHNKRLAKFSYVEIIPLSDKMVDHFRHTKGAELIPSPLSSADIDRVLDGDTSVDDSAVYQHIAEYGESQDELLN
jgi:hypothetical protein